MLQNNNFDGHLGMDQHVSTFVKPNVRGRPQMCFAWSRVLIDGGCSRFSRTRGCHSSKTGQCQTRHQLNGVVLCPAVLGGERDFPEEQRTKAL